MYPGEGTSCVVCQRFTALQEADVTVDGLRCRRCSLQSEIAAHEAAPSADRRSINDADVLVDLVVDLLSGR